MAVTIVSFILIIGFLVLVHEIGHFFAARKFGIGVEEFGLGFPPTIWKSRMGNTEYSLNLIPLGGFVKIKGEDGSKPNEPDSFSAKPIWQRAIIVIAGVFMNIVAGWLIFVFIFVIGAPIEITDDVPKRYVVDQNIVISEVIDESPASSAGFRRGDEIISVNGMKIAAIDMFQNSISSSKGEEVRIEFNRSGATEALAVRPAILEDISKDSHVIGVALTNMGTVRYPAHLAFVAGSRAAYEYLARIASAFGSIIKGLFYGKGLEGIGGPVAIVVATGDVVDMGFSQVLIFTAILSFNLVILNILPFPALDGGRLIFLAAEAIRGKPSRKEVEAWFHRIGFILLMLLAIFVTYRDIIRFGGRIWQAVVG